MKRATKGISVYNSTGKCVIGTLTYGDIIHEIKETSSGILFAYIIGLIKPTDLGALVDNKNWVRAANKKEMFSNFIAKQVGSLYVSGARGQLMTPTMIRETEKRATDYKRAIQHYNEHIITGQKVVAYDCLGLVVKFLTDHSLVSSDQNVNGLYNNECKDICKNELMAGDLVFKKHLVKNEMYHVGVYMGDGSVIHAKSRDDGVLREQINTTRWNRFGRLKCLEGTKNTVVYSRLLKNTGKPYTMGDDVRFAQISLEEKGYYLGTIDAIYGTKTEKAVQLFQEHMRLAADGIIGPKTWAVLIG